MCEYRQIDPSLKDECVVYFSGREGYWIAHSLHTDQIGVGRCALDALVELMIAVDDLLELAKTHDEIRIHRDAPDDVISRAKRAIHMPEELYMIAYKRARGKWPKEFKVVLPELNKHRAVKTELVAVA